MSRKTQKGENRKKREKNTKSFTPSERLEADARPFGFVHVRTLFCSGGLVTLL